MSEHDPKTEPGTGQRLERALGPIAAGMILDMADFMTFGRVGIMIGGFVGWGLGWYLGGALRLPDKWRVPAATMAAVYCMFPGTELIPIATIIGAISRFLERPKPTDTKGP